MWKNTWNFFSFVVVSILHPRRSKKFVLLETAIVKHCLLRVIKNSRNSHCFPHFIKSHFVDKEWFWVFIQNFVCWSHQHWIQTNHYVQYSLKESSSSVCIQFNRLKTWRINLTILFSYIWLNNVITFQHLKIVSVAKILSNSVTWCIHAFEYVR